MARLTYPRRPARLRKPIQFAFVLLAAALLGHPSICFLGLGKNLIFPSLLSLGAGTVLPQANLKDVTSMIRESEEHLYERTQNARQPKIEGSLLGENVRDPNQVEYDSISSVKLKGTLVENSAVPMKFSLIVSKARSLPLEICHWGIILRGKFTYDGLVYPYVLAERWHREVTIRFASSKQLATSRLTNVACDDAKLSYLDCTNEFETFASGYKIVDFIWEDLGREFSYDPTRQNEDNVTSCANFALRGGLMLCNSDDEKRLIIEEASLAHRRPGE